MPERGTDANARDNACRKYRGADINAPRHLKDEERHGQRPPTIATPRVAIPASALVSGSSPTSKIESCRTTANNFPIRLPTNSDAKKSPPRKPDASEIRQENNFRTIMRAIKLAAMFRFKSSTIAPWPAPRTCGVTIAAAPMQTPPSTGLSQTGIHD